MNRIVKAVLVGTADTIIDVAASIGLVAIVIGAVLAVLMVFAPGCRCWKQQCSGDAPTNQSQVIERMDTAYLDGCWTTYPYANYEWTCPV